MISGFRILSRLYFRQFLRTESKSGIYGNIVVIAYLWIIEIVFFVILKKDGVEVPPMLPAIIGVACLIPDFLLKLMTVQDNTVMDPFLKTRPIPQGQWEHFLILAQFWSPSNLVMPLSLLPGCFLFMPFLQGLLLLLFLYLASAFGGFLVMLLKHRGNYQPETMVKSYRKKAVKSSSGSHIFGIQYRSFLRSRRLKTLFLYVGIIFYLQCISQEGESALIFFYSFIFLLSCTFTQYGLAVEANFFSGIWTRPLPVERLLYDKYRMGMIFSGIGTLLCLPLCIWKDMSLVSLLAIGVFLAGFANLLMLADAFNCVPIDLFGKAFFNNQGRDASFKVGSVICCLVVVGLGAIGLSLLDGWMSLMYLVGLGVAGFIVSKPYMKWLAGRFEKKKYGYMIKYNSK